jgi:hypothetical protein
LVLRSATVIVRGTVRTYLASLDDLTLKVIGVSSALASSAMLRDGKRIAGIIEKASVWAQR